MEAEKITRIDMYERMDGSVFVEKYAEGWTAGTRAISRSENKDMTLDEMVAWLEERGWKVRRWKGGRGLKAGARAWLGQVMPVRTRWGIQYMRNIYTEQRRNLLPDDVQLHAVDFAFEY